MNVTVDPELEQIFPAVLDYPASPVNGLRFVRHSLVPGGPTPAGYSDDLARELLALSGRSERDLSVAWAETASEDTWVTGGMGIVALRIRGADARRLRPIVLADRVLQEGRQRDRTLEDGYGIGAYGDYGSRVVGVFVSDGHSFVATSGETLILVTFAQDSQVDRVRTLSDAGLYRWLPALDPLGVLPGARPLPTLAPDAPNRPDVRAEALLPDGIEGVPLEKASWAGLPLFYQQYVGFLPARLLVELPELDPEDLSAAVGRADGIPKFSVWVIRAPQLSARRLLGAVLDNLVLDDSAGVRLSYTLETVDVGGRTVLFIDKWRHVLCVEDGALFATAPLDATTFDPLSTGSPPPLALFRDHVIATVRALPASAP